MNKTKQVAQQTTAIGDQQNSCYNQEKTQEFDVPEFRLPAYILQVPKNQCHELIPRSLLLFSSP